MCSRSAGGWGRTFPQSLTGHMMLVLALQDSSLSDGRTTLTLMTTLLTNNTINVGTYTVYTE